MLLDTYHRTTICSHRFSSSVMINAVSLQTFRILTVVARGFQVDLIGRCLLSLIDEKVLPSVA
jgi:hypothetical protein